MYFDRFKYTKLGIRPSIGLFSNKRSNSEIRSSISEIVPANSHSDNIRSSGWSDHAFFIEPYVEKRKEKKDRIDKHQDNILEIYKNWHKVQIHRLTFKNDLPRICVPLYIDVVNPLQQYDKYCEGSSHLLGYTSQNAILLDIKRHENEHNRATSQFMSEREGVIRETISKNENISIPEWRSSEDRYPFYKMAKIFEHYMDEAYQHKEIKIEDYALYDGKQYHKLFREPADLIAIADKKNLQYLKDLIDSEPTICRLKKILEDFKIMQNLLNSFGEGIDHILYHAPTHGLQGQCYVEQDLRPRIIRFLKKCAEINAILHVSRN